MSEVAAGERPVVLLVGGSPEPASVETVRRAAAGCVAVVAIDRGLERVLEAGLACDLFCGDGDSVGARGAAAVEVAERAAAGRSNAPGEDGCFGVVRYNPHKDDTDLGLALGEVARRWPGAVVRATCLGGGNPDHLLGVLGRLASYRPSAGQAHENGFDEATPTVEIMEDAYAGRILHAGECWRIEGLVGSRFSFIPLSPSSVVSEAGMRWELDHHRVPLLDDLGISNVIERAQARIACHEGTLACWLFS